MNKFMIAITPDMDLLDASGAFNPGQDGVKDSYSVGVALPVSLPPGNRRWFPDLKVLP